MRQMKKENKNNPNNKKFDNLDETPGNVKLNNESSSFTNIFLYIFLILTIVLSMTLYLYYRLNSNILKELSYVSDVHKIKAFIKSSTFIDENNKNLKISNVSSNNFIKHLTIRFL